MLILNHRSRGSLKRESSCLKKAAALFLTKCVGIRRVHLWDCISRFDMGKVFHSLRDETVIDIITLSLVYWCWSKLFHMIGTESFIVHVFIQVTLYVIDIDCDVISILDVPSHCLNGSAFSLWTTTSTHSSYKERLFSLIAVYDHHWRSPLLHFSLTSLASMCTARVK